MSYDAILIDAGTGNLLSVYNALNHLDISVKISNSPVDLSIAQRIIMPGVGAFGNFMQGLQQQNLIDAIKSAIQKEIPLLGICVGMQALFEFSEELGIISGLAVLPGKVLHFPELPSDFKIPHTGWNQVWIEHPCPLLKQIKQGDYVYFNHSYYCAPANEQVKVASTDYGIKFCSIVQYNFLFGVQFHPEKSQSVGLQILKNFLST